MADEEANLNTISEALTVKFSVITLREFSLVAFLAS